MRVLVVEKHADGALDIAIRAKAGGHDVRYFLSDYDQYRNPVGRGLVERVADWRGSMRWADLVILGGNDYCMVEFDRWRAQGIPIIGGGVESASWERERLKGMAIMRRAGIVTPPARQFNTYEEARDHVIKTGVAYACKPCWDETDKSLSYVASSPQALIHTLEDWRKRHGRPKGPLMLQEKIKGTEFAVGAWFGPGGWGGGWEENFEFKKTHAGDVGENCGEMGTVIRYVRSSKLADMLLKPLEGQLERIGYVGCIDVNAIIDEDGTPFPLEFTNRFGWPAWNISDALLKDDPIEFWAALAAGETPNPFRMNEVAVGVVLPIGDFPHSKIPRDQILGKPIWGLTPSVMENVHLCQVSMGEAPDDEGKMHPCPVTAGDYVCICTGTGDTVQKARAAAYRVVGRIEMPVSSSYRVDIGSRLSRDLDRLQTHGFAKGMVYA
jgi:phosphoribosylamine--glycine ligase